MAQERIFTDEDRDWLKENYPHLSNKKCLLHFKCGYESLKKLVHDCGLDYKDANKYSKKLDKKTKCEWKDEKVCGYCIDCSHYAKGGICSINGKLVGALWQKKCFNK